MMWKQAFTLGLLLWAVGAVNNTKFISDAEPSYGEEYLEDEYVGEEESKSELPVGQWWKNGRALEPKWRDGDNVPLVPFHAITSNKQRSKEEIEFDVEDISSFESNNEKAKSYYSDNVNNKFSGSDVHLSRRRKPPELPEENIFNKDSNDQKFEGHINYKTDAQDLASSEQKSRFDQEVEHHIKEIKFPYENPETIIKYRETFQNQPNEYEMNDEEYQKPRPRKRRPPQNDEFAEARVTYPLYQNIKPNSNSESKTSGSSDLKTLLKKQQGNSLSLSEILQRSNLTLSDLLQGKVNVIDLLKSVNKDDEIEETKPSKGVSLQKMEIHIQEPFTPLEQEVLQYKLLKPEMPTGSYVNNKTKIEENKIIEKGKTTPLKEIELKDQELIGPTSEKEAKMQESSRIIDSKILMTQKMAILENPVKLSTTMKNIHTTLPEIIDTSLPEKSDNTEEDEIMEFSDFTIQNSAEEIKSTEANLDFKDTLTIERDNEEMEPSTEETVMEFNNTEMTTQTELPIEVSTVKSFINNHKNTTNENSYDHYISKMEPDARAEILELFSSGSSAKQLELLLESRNMTLEEFIALRQRGSSQIHLAEVSKQRRQKSYVITAPNEPITSEQETSSEPPEESTTIKTSTVKITETSIINEPNDNIAVEQRVSVQESKILYPDILPNVNNPGEILDIYTAFDTLPQNVKHDNEIPVQKNGSVTFIEVGRVEEIVNEDSIPFNDVYEPGESNIEEIPVTFSRVTPSIIASGVILGVTMIVFVVIFIICRMQQKQKYTYRNTFSRAVFQSPALAARKLSNTSSLNTIMVNVVTTSNTNKPERREIESDYDVKSDMENDSLDGNDSWDTIPDFMK